MEVINIITPPILGYKIYFVPDKNALQGMDIILIKTLGIIIFSTMEPSINLSPKKDKTISESKNKIKQSIADIINILEEDLIKYHEIII